MCWRKSFLATPLFIASADPSTPEPVYGMFITSSRPCTRPSSPMRPWSARKATSMAASRMVVSSPGPANSRAT